MDPDLVFKFVGAAGKIECPVIGEGWIQPAEVQLDGGQMKYRYRKPVRRVRLRSGYFEQFLKLAAAGDPRIVEYARAYGPLVATASQPFEQEPAKPGEQDDFTRLLQSMDSADMWRQTSLEIRNLLMTVVRLEQDESARGKLSTKQRSVVQRQRQGIALKINTWLFTSVRPQVIWTGERWAIRMRVENLLGALALHLLLIVSRKSGVALCGSCGALFEVDGKRKAFCGSCGLPAAQRAASKKLYDTKKLVLRMNREGRSVSEISVATERSIKRVKGWLESFNSKG